MTYMLLGRQSHEGNVRQVIADMDTAQMQVGMGLLEAGLARCEREGHARGVALLGSRIGHINWRSYVAYHKVFYDPLKISALHSVRLWLAKGRVTSLAGCR